MSTNVLNCFNDFEDKHQGQEKLNYTILSLLLSHPSIDPILDLCIIILAIHPNDTCDAEFCSSQEGNKRKILSYNLSEAGPYLRQLAPDSIRNVIYSINTKVEVPVLVSGSSSNHYKEALTLIKNLNTYVRPTYSNTPFYFFDLGLTASEKLKVFISSFSSVITG